MSSTEGPLSFTPAALLTFSFGAERGTIANFFLGGFEPRPEDLLSRAFLLLIDKR